MNIWVEKSNEWHWMWQELAKLEGDVTCENDGEVWQYMGSEHQGEVITHTFRHRCHPKTNQREYRQIQNICSPEMSRLITKTIENQLLP